LAPLYSVSIWFYFVKSEKYLEFIANICLDKFFRNDNAARQENNEHALTGKGNRE